MAASICMPRSSVILCTSFVTADAGDDTGGDCEGVAAHGVAHHRHNVLQARQGAERERRGAAGPELW
jgi:hypothetical protein